MRCTVFGTGYLGATHAVGMAELGHEVIGVDIDPGKIAKLAGGEVPFYEPGLRRCCGATSAAGRLRFTTDYAEAAEFADVHFLGVGTPQKKGEYGADLRHVYAVIDALVPRLRRPAVIVGKSTVPVGTAAELAASRRGTGPRRGRRWRWLGTRNSCARVSPCTTPCTPTASCLVCSRIRGCAEAGGAGAVRAAARRRACRSCSPTCRPPSWSRSRRTPSWPPRSRSSTRSRRCARPPAPTSRLLADALGYDARIGRRFLNAGLGFGGGCLPKDIRAFMARAGELGANHALTFLREVDSINMRRRTRMVELATRACGGSLLGANIAVLGAAFKPESDDVRDSPALNVAGLLQLNGATVNVYDPKAMENSRRLFPTLNYSTSAAEACERADAVLVLTEWAEFVDLDPGALAATVRAKVVVDGRNCLDTDRWQQAGWRVYALGVVTSGRVPSTP